MDDNKHIFAFSINSLAPEYNYITYGVHGFAYTDMDQDEKPIPAIKSKIHTIFGYVTRAQHINDPDSVLVNPKEYVDIYGKITITDDKIDPFIIKAATAMVDQITNRGKTGSMGDNCIVYYDNPILDRVIRNQHNKRMKTFEEERKLFYKACAYGSIEFIYTVRATPNKLTTIKVPKNINIIAASIMNRAKTIANMSRSSAINQIPFDIPMLVKSEVKDYWKSEIDISPLLAFKEVLANSDLDYKDDSTEYYAINRGDDITNIGRKSHHTGYAYVKLNKPCKAIILSRNVLRDKMSDGIGKMHIDTLRIESLRILPGLVIKDLLRYGINAVYKEKDSTDVKTMHDKIVASIRPTTALYFNGIHILDSLKAIINGNDELVCVEEEHDITDQFVTENDKGKKIPTDALKAATDRFKIKIPFHSLSKGKTKNRVLQLGYECPSRNMFVKIIDDETKVLLVVFTVIPYSVKRLAIIIENKDGIGIYNNYHTSVMLNTK